MKNEQIEMIMRYARKEQPQQSNYVLRLIQVNPDGSKGEVSESPLLKEVGQDLEILLLDSGFPCATSELEVLEREGMI